MEQKRSNGKKHTKGVKNSFSKDVVSNSNDTPFIDVDEEHHRMSSSFKIDSKVINKNNMHEAKKQLLTEMKEVEVELLENEELFASTKMSLLSHNCFDNTFDILDRTFNEVIENIGRLRGKLYQMRTHLSNFSILEINLHFEDVRSQEFRDRFEHSIQRTIDTDLEGFIASIQNSDFEEFVANGHRIRIVKRKENH